MAFYLAKTLTMPFDRVLEKVRAELAKEGFAVITEIDVKAAFKEHLDVTFRKYRILGVWGYSLAHRALLAEDKAGLLLPCNVLVQERSEGVCEVAAVDPRETMRVAGSTALEEVAKQMGNRLETAIGRV